MLKGKTMISLPLDTSALDFVFYKVRNSVLQMLQNLILSSMWFLSHTVS